VWIIPQGDFNLNLDYRTKLILKQPANAETSMENGINSRRRWGRLLTIFKNQEGFRHWTKRIGVIRQADVDSNIFMFMCSL